MNDNYDYKPEPDAKIYPQAYYAETERARRPDGPPHSQAYHAETGRARIPETPSYQPPYPQQQQQSHMHQMPQLPLYPPPPQVYITVHVVPTPYPQMGAPYGVPYQRVVAPTDKHAGLAITGFVLGIISLVGALLPCGLGFLMPCASIIFSALGMQSHQHKNLAIAGLICSILGIGISVIALIAWNSLLY
ncbi:hypothetical protein [Ktedonospora formicarum]|uniref:DUF4190 domain-containing protein n=1 Tax=Ktedonospora formicarum TaxID=2778364 RepID=A0A8J3MT44_9CHLR|nr:hypothetical protein [Ktedonospora formicarum]GHO45506.1 hypothetical protein KSX_36690 [Ktedonospora formicarum]